MKAQAYVQINNHGVVLNGKSLFSDSINDTDQINLDDLYKLLNLGYPKYYKMDDLTKLGILGVEILKHEVNLNEHHEDRISQIFMNSYSSLDTDQRHQEFIDKNKMPSPAVFVYTLPNIVMGEIAIRNKFYGENLFILADEFSPEKWLSLAMTQFEVNKADAVIGGWIECFKNDINLRLYFLDKLKEDGFYKII